MTTWKVLRNLSRRSHPYWYQGKLTRFIIIWSLHVLFYSVSKYILIPFLQKQLDIYIWHRYVFSYLTEIKEFNVSSPYLSLTNSATFHIAKRASGETVANIVHGLGKHEKYKKYASCEKNDAQQRILSSSPKVCNKQKSDVAVPLVIEQNIQSKYPKGNSMSMLASFEGFIFIIE